MQEPFKSIEFLDHVRRNLHLPLAITGFSLGCAILISLLLPNKYTATASILIEPPAAADPRVSTAVSPIYLESLKTYEQFAGSDSLFARACDTFHLLDGSGSTTIESFKKRVLEVRKLKDTKLLQISVTLGDPKLAQSVVQYLAERTVQLSAQVAEGSDREAVARARSELAAATTRLDEVRAKGAVAAAAAVTALDSDVLSLSDMRSALAAQAVDAEVIAAEDAAREAEMARTGAADLAAARRNAVSSRARAEVLKTKQQAIGRALQQKTEALAAARTEQARLDARVRSAEDTYEQWARRLAELQAAVGTRGEQLRIIDPGIVPQKPSSPNLLLNCAAALGSSLVVALAMLCITFAVRKQPVAHQHPLQVARRGSA